MAKFEKGNKVAVGKGRPKGSKEKAYLSLKFWFDQLETELARTITVTRHTRDGKFIDSWKTTAVSPDKRAQIFLEAMKMLTSKMKNLPSSPVDSVNNTADAAKMLEELSSNQTIEKPLSDPQASTSDVEVRPKDL